VDPVTHTLTGAALSRAGLHRMTPLATAALVIGANAPDIDVLAYVQGGTYGALAARRGLTHGPLALLLLPLLVAAGVLAWDRLWRRRRRPHEPPARTIPVLALAFVGVLTHSPLDWMNTYGIRLLMPFSERWFYGDALFIIDPWVWLALAVPLVPFATSRRGRLLWVLLGVLATIMVVTAPQVPLAAQLAWGVLAGGLAVATARRWRSGPVPEPTLSAEERSRLARFRYDATRRMERAAARGQPQSVATFEAEHRPRDMIAMAALAAVLLYIGGMAAADAGARRITADAARAEGLVARDLMVAPVPANPFAAEVVVETAEAYHLGSFGWFSRPRVRWDGARIPKGERTPEVLLTLQLQEVRDFLRWSRYPYVETGTDAEGRFVRFGDARYPSRMRGGLSGVVVRIEGTPRVQP
jgi:inner membrane protein